MATGAVAIAFLVVGVVFLSFSPDVVFVWFWTAFVLICFILWFFQFYNKFEWLFLVTDEYILFDSPFMPRARKQIKKFDIEAILINDYSDIPYCNITTTTGAVIEVPSSCLSNPRNIVKVLRGNGYNVTHEGGRDIRDIFTNDS